MAMGGGGGGNMNSDINITPFIDVLLVLLVIFMLTIPTLRKVLEIQVPKEEQSQSTTSQSNNIVLEIKADGAITINTQPVDKTALLAKFHEIYDVRPDKLLFIKADNNRPYNDVITVIDIARAGGVKVFGIAPPTAEEAAAAAASHS
ncbi:MAG TPA: biopolymer transporter ExbD [Gemmatimonadales bacterium]|jgi:biopolymer transport protein ExbD